MGAAISITTRRQIIEGYRSGRSKLSLSQEFQVSYGSVQTLCRRVEADGELGLQPRYQNCGGNTERSDRLIVRAACWLKRRHPKWGAPLIRLLLQKRYPDKAIASARTMQKWFAAKALNRPRSKTPKAAKQWADHVHQIWQVDAKEKQRLADGTAVCWLTVTDERSTAVLAAPVFPPRADLSGPAASAATGDDRDLQTLWAAEGDQGR